MSRTVARNGAPRRPGDEDDICPVCKSSRYLNPNMKFLVNPECYHKMCESCVDRIFSHGPASCPVAGCNRTLRKQRFREQTFEDIQVEREVDIRRRVAKVFNRRQDEFETLDDYNNYLEEVETLTFNLLNGIDVSSTEAKLSEYAAQNAAVISRNATLAHQESANLEALRAAEKEDARLRREAARKEEEDERRAREEGRKEVLEQLTHGNKNATEVLKESKKIELLKRRRAAEQARPHSKPGTFVIKGLKSVAGPKIEKPYDPFGGLTDKRKYYVLQDHYEHPWLDQARTDLHIIAGGYSVQEYCARSMFEAFSGLGVFIEEEVAGRGDPSDVIGGSAAGTATLVE
ncbi:MAG: TFIIH/NER complex subunit [Geoglossum umbratile]|nr:MAG: TFIIH/NER complex subunit [Geoglossum umbratile]